MLQSEALDILKLGHNVYLTGAAGSGKTYVLNQFISHLRDNKIVVGVTASTGIAATHINGITIHSWAGIGIKDELNEDDLKSLREKSTLKKRFRETRVLIIDEVSMLHGARLDMVDLVCRELKDKTKPFGGLQVVLCGDLFQLPPVSRSRIPDFVFESSAWKNMKLQVCYLGEQHRQEDDTLLEILSAIRTSSVDENHFDLLKERFTEPYDQTHTRLYTHNNAVDEINQQELAKLNTKSRTYNMELSGNKKAGASLASNCLAPESLTIKIGAKVMFVANNPQENYANGTLGEVIDFDKTKLPIVQVGHRKIIVGMHSWKAQDGDKVLAEATQVPLRLAWAITVHKSQGMSLDAAEIDLSKSFEMGMGYVALSRVRTMEGLFIKGINNTAMMVNPVITKLDAQLKERSDIAKKQIIKMKTEDIAKFHSRVQTALQPESIKLLAEYDPKILEKLKTWRSKEAKKQSFPAYVILQDETLKYIAALKPQTEKDLAKIKGIGTQKLEKYSKVILKITK
jgi:ATP-dependent DNA helicase PIF1